jgi:hypothetical protein
MKKSVFDSLKELTVGKLNIVKDFFIGSSLKSLGTPDEEEIYSMGRVNRRYPRLRSVLCELEVHLNHSLGVITAIGEPLYPEYTFFRRQAKEYMRTTPSIQQKRAEQMTEILSSGALKPPQREGTVTDLGDIEGLKPNVKSEREY